MYIFKIESTIEKVLNVYTKLKEVNFKTAITIYNATAIYIYYKIINYNNLIS